MSQSKSLSGIRNHRRALAQSRFLSFESLDQRITFDVNQAPINVVPGPQTYTVGDPTVTFGTLNRISTHDADVGSEDMRVTLFVNNGTIHLDSTAGLTFLNGANDTKYLLFDATEDAINNALLNLKYTADTGVTADTLTIDVHDLGHTGTGGAMIDRDQVSLSRVIGVNQSPVNTVPVAQIFDAGTRKVTFGSGNRISTHDADAEGQNLRVTLFVNSGIIKLPTTAGLIFRSGGNNTRYMVFDGSEANINNAMLNMTYTANVGVTSDVFTIDTHDLGHSGTGGAKTDRDTVTLTKAGVAENQGPVNTVPGPQTYSSSGRTVTFGSLNRISTSDADVGASKMRVTLFVNNGVLKLGSTSGLTFLNGGNNTRYMLFDATLANINNALLNLQYKANVGSTSDELTFDVHDLGHNGTGGAKTDRDTVLLTEVGLV